MQTEWVVINEVPTKILTWGKTLTQAKTDTISEDYIICIPGNPGIVDFYIEFLDKLHQDTKKNVWIIGHAGHSRADTVSMPPYEENKELYSLEGQIKHKIAFIESYIPKNARITFIGHSIGSYIILKLLKIPSIKSRVVKSYLLFPTIEYMAESKKGKLFMNFFRYLLFLIIPLTVVFNLLPVIIQNALVRIYLKLSSIPDNYKDCIRDFVHPFTINNITSMALQEMCKVRERDNEVLVENISKIKLYYGANDDWCPVTYYYNIKKEIVNIDAEVCDKGFPHAFVLHYSKAMAAVIVDWMQD